MDFSFKVSTDATTWTDVKGQSFTEFPNPGSSKVTFTFESAVAARYVCLYVTKLAADENGNHYLQMAEFAPIVGY